jgi:cation:H+ antiporter
MGGLVMQVAVLAETLGTRGIYLGALRIIATAFFLWGILERRNRTVFGMGIDSAMVLATYIGGMVIYYFYLD